MSVESGLYDALKGLVGNRVYPIVFPQPDSTPVWPAIRYVLISAVPAVSICGDSGEVDIRRYQLDLVDNTAASVRSLKIQVLAAMVGFNPPAIYEGSSEDYDGPTNTFRISMDYTVHISG